MEALQKQRESMRPGRPEGAAPMPTGSPSANMNATPAAVIANIAQPGIAQPTVGQPNVAQPGALPNASKTAAPTVRVSTAKAHVDEALQNSLGMKFAPVGDVLFSVWLTRVQDFEAFAKATNLKSNAW